MGNAVPRVIDNVVYVPTGDPSEYAAYLLARTSPVGVSSLLFDAAPLDVHDAAQALLTKAHQAECRIADTGSVQTVVESAVTSALPDAQMSTHDAVTSAVLDALRTAGYRVVRA